MYKCGFTEPFQAVAEHEKTCSKRVPAVEAMANSSDGAGSSAVRAGFPSTAADAAVRRSAAVAAKVHCKRKFAKMNSCRRPTAVVRPRSRILIAAAAAAANATHPAPTISGRPTTTGRTPMRVEDPTV
jgi:hypothetical protein